MSQRSREGCLVWGLFPEEVALEPGSEGPLSWASLGNVCVCPAVGVGVGLLGCVCMYVCMSVHAHWEWEQGVLGERVSNLFLVLRLEAGGISGIQGRPV